jgi:anaerobic C4-dicarboxylate transporter DcuA
MMMWDRMRGNSQLHTLDIYQERLALGVVAPPKGENLEALPAGAKKSVMIFLGGLVTVMVYATMISDKVGLKTNSIGKNLFYEKTTDAVVDANGSKVVETTTALMPIIGRDAAIIGIMLAVATLIALFCNVNTVNVLSASVFKSGMSAVVCVLGVAWLGTAFVKNNEAWIKDTAGEMLTDRPWTLAIVLFLASALLYSQAATTRALMPTALSIGVAPLAAIAAFPAVSALFVLPTYPTLLAAVEMDDTGSTRIGKFVFDHPFVVPGMINIAIAVALGFLFGGIFL